MKFTFKKEPRETGLASVANPHQATAIKLNKLEVGVIAPPNRWTHEREWTIRFAVNDATMDHCGWKWVTLKAKFDDEPSARAFVAANAEKLLKLNLHSFSND